MSNVDINRTIVFNKEGVIKPNIQHAVNKNYLNRLFVLTNKGI